MLHTWGIIIGVYFGRFWSKLAAFLISITLMGTASPSHPQILPTTCPGEEGNGQVERCSNPSLQWLLMLHGAYAQTDGDATLSCERTGGTAAQLVLGSSTQLKTQQGVYWLGSLLRSSPGKSKMVAAMLQCPRGPAVPALQCCIPSAPWQQAEQLVQSGCSQKTSNKTGDQLQSPPHYTSIEMWSQKCTGMGTGSSSTTCAIITITY